MHLPLASKLRVGFVYQVSKHPREAMRQQPALLSSFHRYPDEPVPQLPSRCLRSCKRLIKLLREREKPRRRKAGGAHKLYCAFSGRALRKNSWRRAAWRTERRSSPSSAACASSARKSLAKWSLKSRGWAGWTTKLKRCGWLKRCWAWKGSRPKRAAIQRDSSSSSTHPLASLPWFCPAR